MINRPSYLNDFTCGPGGLGQQANLNEIYAQSVADCDRPGALSASERVEMECIKAQYAKTARCEELMNLAQQLEHMRQRLVHIDMNEQAGHLSDVIGALVYRWNEDRAQR